MRLKPLTGGMVLCASLPLMGITTSPPTPSHADVSISVSAAESCVWYMENLPFVINMNSEAKYSGDPLLVSATVKPAIGFSGDPALPGYTAPCSFFNSSFTTKNLRVAIDSSEFVATYGGNWDETLSFGLDQRPLSVQVSKVEQECRSVTGMPLTVPANLGWGKGKSDVSTPFEVVTYSDVPGSGVKNFFSSGNSAKCSPELEFVVEISSAQSGPPEGAGLTYIFTGPSITFSMENPAAAEEAAEVQNYESVAVQAQQAFRDLAPNPVANYTFRTLSTSKEFFFSTDSSERIYAGTLDGKPADYRVVPTSASWTLTLQGGTAKLRNGFNTSIYYARNGKTFSARVSVNYRIDYRYPGADWVIGAATGNRLSNTATGKVN